ncbi:MAG: hypothetical protein HYV07_16570 [Deltaproteobacteria bacterium]|nr:hypothetical protein [Deltaproteobacteria bacterium]
MRSIALLASLCSTACLSDLELEERTFPCRSADDCVDGFVCDPIRFVCLRPGTDGGVVDSGALATGIGDPCPDGSCAEGTCVDGVCCSTPCTGTCERCDVTPGTCSPSGDGTDPDRDCEVVSIDCGTLVCELAAGLCYACLEGAAVMATCDGRGGCRADGCLGRGRGRLLGGCHDGCGAATACIPGALARSNDEPSELCASGGACTLLGGATACCSPLGTCCPACDADDPLCE